MLSKVNLAPLFILWPVRSENPQTLHREYSQWPGTISRQDVSPEMKIPWRLGVLLLPPSSQHHFASLFLTSCIAPCCPWIQRVQSKPIRNNPIQAHTNRISILLYLNKQGLGGHILFDCSFHLLPSPGRSLRVMLFELSKELKQQINKQQFTQDGKII